MLKNKIHLTAIFILILSIWGCGTMAKEEDALSIPQKVSIEMPKALAVESTQQAKPLAAQKAIDKNNNLEKSIGYLELKEDVTFLEAQRVILEINLLFINEVIQDIDTQCKDTALEAVCTIEAYSLSFLFDENLSKKVKALSPNNVDYDLGDTLTFGEIEFVEHTPEKNYRYTLKMDTTFGDEESNSFERISWSKDESLILSEYLEEGSDFTDTIKIDFRKNEDQSRQMLVEDGFMNKLDKSSHLFHFNMLKQNDKEESYDLNSTSLSINSDATTERFSSVGQLSNLGGYLNFTGEFDNEVFKENDTFDKDGNILGTLYCYSGLDCDLEEEETWFNF